MAEKFQRAYNDDRPLGPQKKDRLGFSEAAIHVAKSITDFASPEGFVLGLEGEWGTGKSSFIHLISDALKSSENNPEIFDFSPWMISSTDALLNELFNGLSSAALKIVNSDPAENGTVSSRDAAEALRSKLQSFRSHLRKVESLAKFGDALNVPLAGVLAKAMEAAAGASESFGEEPSLEEQKEDLKSELRKLSRKIVVFIDDLDRLEPNEASEVVRLVRAVADFPNVVYVLCYSKKVLADSLISALHIKNGEGYIEKIVQVEFSVPEPEPFDLRRMFREDLARVLPNAFRSDEDSAASAQQRRLSQVIDIEGGTALKSPRDVVRAVNSIVLYAGPVAGKVDLGDVVWLQLLRLQSIDLYKWVEGYANGCAALASGAHISDSARERYKQNLVEILEREKRDIHEIFCRFQSILPRIDIEFEQGNENWNIYCSQSNEELAGLVNERRLGSPQHYRYYFALTKPSGAIDDADFDYFLDVLEKNPQEAAVILRDLFSSERKQGGLLGEAMLSRISSNMDHVPGAEFHMGLIEVLADTMDHAALKTGKGDWGRYWVWVSAESMFSRSIAKLSELERAKVLRLAFGNGASLGWLTNLLRGFLFAHGRTGDSKKPESEWTLTDSELDLIIGLMIDRYRSLDLEHLLSVPQFVHVFYAWMQSGDDRHSEVLDWVAESTRSDLGFLMLLANMRSWAAVNDVVYYPFDWSRLEHLLDVDKAKLRLEGLRNTSDPQMIELIKSVDDGLRAARHAD